MSADNPRVEKICALYRVLGDSLDLDETLSSFDQQLRQVLRYDAISIHLNDAGELLPLYASGESFTSLVSPEMSAERGFLASAARQNCPSLSCRVAGLPGFQTALAVPLEHLGAVTALLALYRTDSSAFSAADVRTLQSVAPKLASAIENARAHQASAKLAGIDPLTGVLNVRSLFQRLDAELARTRRSGEGVAVLHCALDGLQDVPPDLNRSVLRRVAARIRESCREYDSVAWTGDDFVLVLVNLSPGDLREKHSKLQSAVEEVGFLTGLPLSVGIGAAFYPKDAPDTEGLLTVASERLNQARHARSL